MSGFVSGISDAVGGTFSTIFGGKSRPQTYNTFSNASPQEQAFANGLQNDITNLYNNPSGANQDLTNEFQQHLTSFLTNNNNGNVSDQDLQNATNFVNKTFTQPAQAAVNQQVSNASAAYGAKAAAEGRDPNLDQSTQQSIANAGINANLGLQEQAGARIQQQTQDIYGRGLGSLNAGMQGTGFLNSLGQQAFNNRLNLLNAGTQQLGYMQRNRGVGFAGNQTNPGILGGINSGLGQVASLGSNISNLGSGLGGLGGSTPYLSSAGGDVAGLGTSGIGAFSLMG